MPEEDLPHPRLAKARDALAADGFQPLYETCSRHPLGPLRLEIWAAETEMRLLRSIEIQGALALRLFTLESMGWVLPEEG